MTAGVQAPACNPCTGSMQALKKRGLTELSAPVATPARTSLPASATWLTTVTRAACPGRIRDAAAGSIPPQVDDMSWSFEA